MENSRNNIQGCIIGDGELISKEKRLDFGVQNGGNCASIS